VQSECRTGEASARRIVSRWIPVRTWAGARTPRRPISRCESLLTCGTVCNMDFPAGEKVELMVSPAHEGFVAEFSGDCSGFSPCTVVMDAARSEPVLTLALPTAPGCRLSVRPPLPLLADGLLHILLLVRRPPDQHLLAQVGGLGDPGEHKQRPRDPREAIAR
jgi:hypothetical protein